MILLWNMVRTKPLEVDWETSENMLANGDAAMIHMGDSCQSTLDSFNPDANLGFLPTPVGDGAEDCTLLSSCNWTYIADKMPNVWNMQKNTVIIF